MLSFRIFLGQCSCNLPVPKQHTRFLEIVDGLREKCNCFDHAFYVYHTMLGYQESNLYILKNTKFLMRTLHNEVNFKLGKDIYCSNGF